MKIGRYLKAPFSCFSLRHTTLSHPYHVANILALNAGHLAYIRTSSLIYNVFTGLFRQAFQDVHFYVIRTPCNGERRLHGGVRGAAATIWREQHRMAAFEQPDMSEFGAKREQL
ncbi:hypothetical protein [Hahella sp. NBU794]|uniref:hypothetical protein n=1 Tax=Hahella sp. NBU794 TaxID=3422590 RepID=UPI003D6DBC91